jgi:hypothetical protein
LNEQKEVLSGKLDARTKKYQNMFINRLIESINPSDKYKEEKTKIYNKNLKINEGINSMIKDINKMLDE